MIKKTLIVTGVTVLIIATTVVAVAAKKPNFRDWVEGKIAAIEQSVADFGNRIVLVETAVTANSDEIASINSQIGILDGRVTTIEGQSPYEYPESIKPRFFDPATSIGYWQVQPGVHKLSVAVNLENDYGRIYRCQNSWWKFSFTDPALGVVARNNTYPSYDVEHTLLYTEVSEYVLEFRTDITRPYHLPMPTPGSEVEIDANVVCYGEHFHITESYIIP